VVVLNAYGSVTSAPATLSVAVPVTIISGPTDLLATNGDTISFTAAATGSQPIRYQWFFNQTNLLSSETNTALSLAGVTPGLAGLYSVAIGNPYNTITSSPARLTVVVPAFIVENPTNTVATNGSWASFFVVADGTSPLGYQWYFNETNNLV